MEAPTLEIHVVEHISVKDVVFEVVRAVIRFIEHFIEVAQQVVKQEPVSNNHTRAPPDLNIKVSDGVGVFDRFG